MYNKRGKKRNIIKTILNLKDETKEKKVARSDERF